MWVAEWNEVVFTDESRICLQHHDGQIQSGDTVERGMLNSWVMHRVLWCPSLPSWFATAIFQQDNVPPYTARIVQRLFVNHQIELLPWPMPALQIFRR
ncbi:hypothetical protein TNCV_710431 [Trichonephila clavipes]|nr:hypothetical protein TNCV_710431 [Trichonephila clavipes]